MDAFILVVLLLTASGPEEVRIDFAGRGWACEQAATQLRLGNLATQDGSLILTARCVREYDT